MTATGSTDNSATGLAYLWAPKGRSRRGKSKPKRISQALITRSFAASMLSGEAESLGRSYAPAVAYDDEGYRIRDTRRLHPPQMVTHDHHRGGHDTRQRRRARARAAAGRAAATIEAPRRVRRRMTLFSARGPQVEQ